MSGGRSNKSGHNGGVGGSKISSIPPTSRKVVQSLKEIVSRSEDEIYLALQECNMDPNEAINRLLSQDTFQEVKSRREKKKEVKDTSEPRPRGFNTASSRGGSGGATRHDGRSGYTQFNSSDPGSFRAKTAYKKENGTEDSSFSSTSAYGLPSTNSNRRPGPGPVSYSSVAAEYKPQPTGSTEGVSSSSQPSPVAQPAWVGVPGQVSMADIVKRGRQKASVTPNISNDTSHSFNNAATPAVSYHNVNHLTGPSLQESHHGLEASQEFVPKVSEPIQEADVHSSQHASHDEWNMPEESSVRGPSVFEPSPSVEVYTDPSIQSNSQSDRTNQHLESWSEDVRGIESDTTAEHLNQSYIRSSSASGRQIPSDNTGGASHFDEDSFNNMNSYPPQLHTFEQHEGNDSSSPSSIPNYSVSPVEDVNVAVSSAAANLQQLSLQEERGVHSVEITPPVIIPDHLQVPIAELSHLSFGSFGARIPGSYGSNSLKSNLEEPSIAPNTTSSDRAPEYYGDEGLVQSTPEGNVVAPRTSAGTYDSLSQSELMKQQDGGESLHAHQYSFPTAAPGGGYTLDTNTAQLNSAFQYEQQTNSQMQNHPLSTVMQAYSNSLQAPNAQSARESSDHPYSAFLASQAMPTKYNSAASSINGPSLSMPESLKPSMFSMPPHQTLGTGPALPQHLAVHPYTQPTLPLGHFANMIHGYPYHLPQSFAYMPPAYQQAYAGILHNNNNAGIKYTSSSSSSTLLPPLYKTSGLLPQSATTSAAYGGAGGGFGSSLNLPGGSFPLNPSTTNTSTTIGYDDLMSSQQYKESAQQFLPLQQNDNSTVWVQGPGSRQVSAVPASTYYSFQGQQPAQQHNGFRQAQPQPSQHYGNLSYQNFYHSQPGVSQELQQHQQQTQNEGALGASQGAPPTKQTQQLWQNSY